MSHTSTYLQLSKSNTYYFRLRIPKNLVPVIGRKEIHRSLKTSFYQEALVRAGRLLGAAQRLFSSAMNGTIDWTVLTWDFISEKISKRVSSSVIEVPKVAQRSPKFPEVVSKYLAEQSREGVGLSLS